jgi:hypothetical protein
LAIFRAGARTTSEQALGKSQNGSGGYFHEPPYTEEEEHEFYRRLDGGYDRRPRALKAKAS